MWFTLLFTTFLVSVHYSSWLSASLTVDLPILPFDDFQAIIDDGSFKIGTVRGTSVANVLEVTK